MSVKIESFTSKALALEASQNAAVTEDRSYVAFWIEQGKTGSAYAWVEGSGWGATTVRGQSGDFSDTTIDGVSVSGQELVFTSGGAEVARVSMTKDAVGLSNVDNTSDASKPLSSATSAALLNKADNSRVDALESNIQSKAPQADLDSLSQAVDGKASQADIDSLSSSVATKASLSELNSLSSEINLKASKTDLSSLVSVVDGKANIADLSALTTAVSSKADTSVTNSLNSRILSLEENSGAGNTLPTWTIGENMIDYNFYRDSGNTGSYINIDKNNPIVITGDDKIDSGVYELDINCLIDDSVLHIKGNTGAIPQKVTSGSYAGRSSHTHSPDDILKSVVRQIDQGSVNLFDNRVRLVVPNDNTWLCVSTTLGSTKALYGLSVTMVKVGEIS